MAELSFSIPDADRGLVEKIVARAAKAGMCGPGYRKIDLEMDLVATSANGCPLDMGKLLQASDFDFAHDVQGIAVHLDRSIGKLRNLFWPRCAIPNSDREVADG